MNRLDELTLRLADSEIIDDELAELLALLDDPDACQQFKRLLTIEGALRPAPGSVDQRVIEQLAQERSQRIASGVMSVLERDGSTAKPATSRRPWIWYGGAAAAVLVMAVIAWSTSRAASEPVATLQQIAGNVTVVSHAQPSRAANLDPVILSGDTIQVRGSGSSGVVVFHDGSELRLVGDTRVTCSEHGSKHVQLHAGSLSASVRPQPAGQPLLVTTADLKVSVLGTQFSVSAVAERTDVRVVEGNVRLTRVSDGSSVEVAGGERAVSAPKTELLVEPEQPLQETWDVDFEAGLPTGWQCGVPETSGLPNGSHGAVRAAHTDDSDDFMIITPNGWTDGLFEIAPQNYLNYRIKFERPGFYHVLLGMRDAEAKSAANFEFQESNRPHQPGQWRTVSIPLAAFKRIPPGPADTRPFEQRTGGPPDAGSVAYFLLFSTQRGDRGMVIDRIWISREPPTQE